MFVPTFTHVNTYQPDGYNAFALFIKALDMLKRNPNLPFGNIEITVQEGRGGIWCKYSHEMLHLIGKTLTLSKFRTVTYDIINNRFHASAIMWRSTSINDLREILLQAGLGKIETKTTWV